MQLAFEANEEHFLAQSSLPKAHDPLLNSFRELSGRIGILGGSFDPPHLGHLTVAKATMRLLNLDAVVLLPTIQNPLKKLPGASAEHRLGMIKAMLEHECDLFVSPIELEELGPSYTAQTLEKIHAELNPGSELFFIIGSDTANGLKNWRSVEKLPELATFVLTPRAGITADPAPPIPLLKVEEDEFPTLYISSAEIREKLRRDEDVVGLSPSVSQYIQKHSLYQQFWG